MIMKALICLLGSDTVQYWIWLPIFYLLPLSTGYKWRQRQQVPAKCW